MRKPSPEKMRSAAKILREKGWTKGDYVGEDHEHCAIGSILAVELNDSQLTNGDLYPSSLGDYATYAKPEVDYLAEMLGPVVGEEFYGDQAWGRVTSWNDKKAPNVEAVITLLEQAAEKLEAEL